MELILYGRGGQGGVTLAKLIATCYFLRGEYGQAFGVYAAERSGAPLQAFVRIDKDEITNHNQVRHPDHVVVLDRTLIGPGILAGLKRDGWMILNTPDAPAALADRFPGRCIATIDATQIASAHKLGTRTVPIVNTTMFGAIARVFGLTMADVQATFAELKFDGANLDAAQAAFDAVAQAVLPGEFVTVEAATSSAPPVGLLDDDVGQAPKIRTGAWATRRPERRRLLSPCMAVCPAGNDIQGFVAAISKERNDEALEILLNTTPLPGVCGRVCPAPCMDSCNRHLFDESVQIRDLERHAADRGRLPLPTPLWRDESVAVIGSGPAGLSAAYHLARFGYPVTIFEGGDELGGLLRTGIPEYRLPRTVLDREIDFILRHGVRAVTGRYVDRSQLLALTLKFDAVFVASGLQEMRTMNLGHVESDVVLQGIDFLDRVRTGNISLDGKRVVVIGGGNTAIDAARSALRVGARRVRVLYRRSRDEMPAIPEEIEEALEERVSLEELVLPVRLRREAREAVLTCARMRLGEPDESGRPQPIMETSEDREFDVPCDVVILALGQTADLTILPEGSEVHEAHELLGLSQSPIFVGGDLATNEGTVAAAIGSGRRAALQIHHTLAGDDHLPAGLSPVATPENMHWHVFTPARAHRAARQPAERRRRRFTEVRQGLNDAATINEAKLEAGRCLSCGVCNECDRCVTHCPEGILQRDGDGYRFNYDYCKGCGVCASECPRGVIYLSEL